MSLEPDGTYCCDRCGADVGNAGVDRAATIVDTEPGKPGSIRRLNLCLTRPDPNEPGKEIRGCRDRVLTKRALRHHYETRTV